MAGRGVLGRALRRFWALALAAGLVAGLASWLAVTSLTSTTYSATGLFIVPTATPAQTVAGSNLPESSFDAEGLAQTYELLLVDDAELLDALSAATGVATEDLRERAVAENVPSTPAVRVTYSGETAAEVRGYFSGLEEVVTSTGSQGLAPGSLRALSLPTEVEEQAGLAPAAPVLAVLAGLLVGLGGAVLLERVDRRIVSAADLRDHTAWAVFDVRDQQGSTRLETVALRLAGADDRSVAVVTTPASSPEVAEAVAARLRGLAPGASGTGRTPTWVAAGQVATDGHAEQAVLENGTAIVVVTPSSRARVVEDALQRVVDTGVEDVAVLLSDPVAGAGPEVSTASSAVFGDDLAGEAPVGGGRSTTHHDAPAEARPTRGAASGQR